MNSIALTATRLNKLQSYDQLGYDNRMNKVPDASFSGVRDKNFISTLAFDSQFEGVDVGKLTSNKLNQEIKMGNMTIDGKNNRITVSDGKRPRILLGYLRNGF
jgi:hypothetical protein